MINNGMYIVEILRGGEDLLYEMDEMNRWMDQHVRAPKIQFYWVAEVLVFRVTFNTVTGATAFARAFDGRLLDPRTPEPDAFAPRRNRVGKWNGRSRLPGASTYLGKHFEIETVNMLKKLIRMFRPFPLLSDRRDADRRRTPPIRHSP